MYEAFFHECQACLRLERAQHAQAKQDETAAKDGGFVPHMARLWQVFKKTPQ